MTAKTPRPPSKSQERTKNISPVAFFLAFLASWRLVFVLILAPSCALAAEVMPPAPTQYVNDYAGVLSNPDQLNGELEQFERQTSNQILVAIYPTMQSDSSIEDYTVRIANTWKAGTKKYDNGAILFVFIQQHKMYIQVGYGLEGALPDALCEQIIQQEIVPQFKQGDYNAGITNGIHALMAGAKGEYKGNGKTAHGHSGSGIPWFWIIVGVIVLIRFFLRRATMYGNSGRSSQWHAAPFIFGALGGFGGGRSSGGGGYGGGGGGFSGGGGSFGGGGAGGSW
jgi:uncharacterized protein